MGKWLRQNSDLPWLVMILLVAVALRALNLDQQSLRMDEGMTHARMILPPTLMLQSLFIVRDQVPLYYVVTRLWTLVSGTAEFSLRFPSLFFSVLNVAALYHLGRASGRRWVGRLTALLGAISPFEVFFACEARMYGMGGFFVTTNMLLFLSCITGRRRRFLWPWFIVTAALMYLVHYFTFFIAVVQLAFFLLSFRHIYRLFRRWVLAQAVACVPVGIWTAVGYWQFRTLGLQGAWIPRPTWLTPLRTFWNFSLGYDGDLTPWVVVGLVAWAAAFVMGIIRRNGVQQKWHRLMVVWLALPPAMTFIISFIRRPVYVDRYLSICLPAFLALVTKGALRSPRRWLWVGLVTLLLAATLILTIGVLRGERLPKPDWRSAVRHVLAQARPGDRLAIQDIGLFVTHYYAGDALPIELLDKQDLVSGLTDTLSQQGRVWFLYRDPLRTNHKLDEARSFDPYKMGDPQVAAWLHDHARCIVGEWYWNGLYLALLDPAEN